MKRKIIKQGHNTFTITLPKNWCEKNNLTGKDEINLEEYDNQLTITATPQKKSREIMISSKELERVSLAKVISASYELGLDKITMDLNKKKTICWYYGEDDLANTVNFFVERLIGFEVTSQTETKLTIEKLSEPLLKLDSVMARLFSIIIEWMKNYIEILENRYEINLSENELRHDNISRFTSLAWRIVYENKNLPRASALNYFILINVADKVGDFLRYSYRETEIEKKPNDKLLKIVKKTMDYVRLTRAFHTKYDISKINEMEELRGKIKKLFTKINDASHKDIRVAGYYETIMDLFYGSIKPRMVIEIDKIAK